VQASHIYVYAYDIARCDWSLDLKHLRQNCAWAGKWGRMGQGKPVGDVLETSMEAICKGAQPSECQ
jgi:hypothetical protein